MDERVQMNVRVTKALRKDLELQARLERRSLSFMTEDLLRRALDQSRADMLDVVKAARSVA